MFKDFKQSQRGKVRNPMAVRDPKARIYLMVILLLGVIVGMFSLGNFAKNPKNRTTPNTPALEVKEADDGVVGVPVLDRSVLDKIEDESDESRAWWQNDVMTHLILEARGTPAVQDFNYNLVPLNEKNLPLIAKDSKGWRGRYVRFRGELEFLREEPYEELYGASEVEIGIVHRGRLRVNGGEMRVSFVTPLGPIWSDPNTLRPIPKIRSIVDGWVRGRGIFVKNFIDEIGDEAVPSVLIVATKIERDYATVPVESFADIPFDEIDDEVDAGTPDGRAVLAKEFPRALYRLVKFAESRAGDEGKAQREADGVKVLPFPEGKAFEELVGQPKKHRGNYYRGLGVIALQGIHYDAGTIQPNDAGVTEAVNGWINTDRHKLVQFIAPAPLAYRPWKARTRVRFGGYFYKTKLYRARMGKDHQAPLFVLTELEEVVPAPPDYTGSFIVAGLFILGFAVLILVVLREDKTKESYRAMRRKRRASIS